MCVYVFMCNMNIYAYVILIIAVMNIDFRGIGNGKRSWGQIGKGRDDINVIVFV